METQLKSINKKLVPQEKSSSHEVLFHQFESQAAEFLSVAENIKKEVSSGKKPSQIAILARGKKDILAFLPYLHNKGVKVSYEHDENVLDSPSVYILILLSRLVRDMHTGLVDNVNALLPEVLSHPAFNLSPQTIWQLSLKSYKNKQNWLETMQQEKGDLKNISDWLLDMAKQSVNMPVESMIDLLFGNRTSDSFTSPFKSFFFAKEKLEISPDEYIIHLQSLATIRTNIREYRPHTQLYLKDFVDYVNLAKSAGITLKNHYSAELIDDAVQVMTAHKSKGLEFESVYILNAGDDTWGSKSRGYSNRLSYSENVPIGRAGDSYDDKLRLFFVAMTRAKKHLNVSSSRQSLSGKTMLSANFLSEQTWQEINASNADEARLESAEYTWQSHVSTTKSHSLGELLTPQLKNYRISATHLNNFIDITSGGPQNFLLSNLLHFPQSLSPSAAMGSSVHKALQKAHQHLRVTDEKRPIEDVVGDFDNHLKLARLPSHDYVQQSQKGSDALRIFLENSYERFSPEQDVEFDFSSQGSTYDNVRLTGIIDVMNVDIKNKTIKVTDYKTGKPATSWKGASDFEKIKLHKYKQQLMFYKLLIESSRDFDGYKVEDLQLEFVEPTPTDKLVILKADFTNEDLSNFKKLLLAVWHNIANAKFIDTDKYEKNHKGILNFEKDLIT